MTLPIDHVTDHRQKRGHPNSDSQFARVVRWPEWIIYRQAKFLVLSALSVHPCINDPRPRLVPRLSSLSTHRPWSQFPLRRVLISSPWPLAHIDPVCLTKHGIETKRDGPQADQDARGSSKGSGFQCHIPRCLARRDHRLLSGTWLTAH